MHVIVALGVASAGKSAVLSALADRPGLFPSADVPGSTTCLMEQSVGPVLLVDSPGLDVDDTESANAIGAARRAGTILFCHSLRMGELRRLELATLGGRLDPGDRRRICMVLTHADNLADNDVIAEVSGSIATQLGGIGMHYRPVEPSVTSLDPVRRRPFNVVGVATYWAGINAIEPARRALLRRSGIPRLRTHLWSLALRAAAAAGSSPGT